MNPPSSSGRITPVVGKPRLALLPACLLLGLSPLAVHADPGDSWSLPSAGTNDSVANAWTGSSYGSSSGNPYAQAGSSSGTTANWYAVYQSTGGATFDSAYSLMYYAYQYSYVGDSIWSGDPTGTSAFDPHPTYGRDYTLSSTSAAGYPNSYGAASGLFFQAPQSGTFSVNIGGNVSISSNVSGWAQIEVFTLTGSFSGDTFTATGSTPLEQFIIDPNNVSGNGATGSSFSYINDTLSLTSGEILGLRLYDVAPGSAASGPANIDFNPADGGSFSITETAVVPEPSSYLLFLLGLAVAAGGFRGVRLS